MKHLAIFDKKTIQKIFSGKKTMDIRLSRRKVLPFGHISSGDKILIKETGGKVLGEFNAARVISYDNLDSVQLEKVKRDYNRFIKMDSLFWHEREDSKYGTIIFIDKVQPVLIPMFFKKRDRRPWMVL